MIILWSTSYFGSLRPPPDSPLFSQQPLGRTTYYVPNLLWPVLQTKSIMSTQINHDPFHLEISLWNIIHRVRQWDLFWTEYRAVESDVVLGLAMNWQIWAWAWHQSCKSMDPCDWGIAFVHRRWEHRLFIGDNIYLLTFFSSHGYFGCALVKSDVYGSFIFWDACVSLSVVYAYATLISDRYWISFRAASPRYFLFIGFPSIPIFLLPMNLVAEHSWGT